MIDKIKFEINYFFTEDVEGLLWVLCAIIIPTSLVFITAILDGKL